MKRGGDEAMVRYGPAALAGVVAAIASLATVPRADEPAVGQVAATMAGSPPAYWQAPPLPTAVIQGGAIPPGWQPQAVPYQGVGPDGQPLTMYFAPTYVFTYQSGPPVLGQPQGNRRMPGSQPVVAAPVTSGWNYATTGAAPVATTLPAGTVTRYRPAYQFPDNARALQGSTLVPPGPLPGPSPSAAENWGGLPPATSSTVLSPPPTQWVPAAPQAALPPAVSESAGQWAAPAAIGGATAVAMQPSPASGGSPPPASLPPQIQPLQPLSSPPTVPVARHSWRVVGVYDGDTVTCLDEAGQQQKVRLADIDAPESSQDYGRAARESLAGMVFGRTVEVVDGGRDANGVSLGRLFVDGQDVNRQMVATGNAWADPAAVDPSLAAAQADAQARSLGLWAQPNPTAPWNTR